MKRIILFFVLVIAVGIVAIVLLQLRRPATDIDLSDRVNIVASFYPLAHFAQKVGGDIVDVKLLAPPGVDAHDFEPSPKDVLQIEAADLFIFQGEGFDPWAEAAVRSLDTTGMVVVEMTKQFSLSAMEGGEDRLDPHIWLDPMMAKQMVDAIQNALLQVVPETDKSIITRNAIMYKGQLDKLHQSFTQGLSSCQLGSIVVAHDAFGYLAKRYDFDVISISGISPQDEPSARRLGEIAELVESLGVKYIFSETLTSPKLSETLADEVGAQTMVLNPIEGLSQAQVEAGEDYISVMGSNLANLRVALTCQ